MKRSVLYLALGAALLTTFVSCNETGKKDSNAAYEDKSASSANDVIEYTNLIVDLSNKNSDYVERLVNNADRVTELLSRNGNPAFLSSIIKPIMISMISHGKVKVEEPVDALNKADQQFFKEKVASFKGSFDKLKTTYTQLDDYLKAQDYKDDKGAKGLALADSIRNNAQVFFEQKAVLMKRVSEVADASEAIILKDSPIKEYVLAMKADMQSVRDYINLLGEGGADFAKISDKAQAAYDALEKSQAAHAGIDMANAAKESKDGYYKNFYDSFHQFLLTAKRIMRDAREKGEMTDSQLESLDSALDTMIGRYNSFTK
ncbi:DUF3829 domain-containing protein [Chitinophaga sp. CC14]|uniref:DUF3829 domain-containing protein n=1 Tax=Chitinophaga sp. CC14 TaxID=3029199 RepID=UPI003B79E93C